MLLIGGTLAIGAALFGIDRHAGAPQRVVKVVQLAPVVVTAKRLAPATALAQRTDRAAPRAQ